MKRQRSNTTARRRLMFTLEEAWLTVAAVSPILESGRCKLSASRLAVPVRLDDHPFQLQPVQPQDDSAILHHSLVDSPMGRGPEMEDLLTDGRKG